MSRILMAFAAFFISTNLAMAQAPADSRMKRIAETKSIKIGYRAAAAPFSFLNPEKQPAGYTVDLCKSVVDLMGQQLGGPLKIEWVQVTTQNRFEMVASGQADMECGSSTITLASQRSPGPRNPI